MGDHITKCHHNNMSAIRDKHACLSGVHLLLTESDALHFHQLNRRDDITFFHRISMIDADWL